MHKQRVKYFTKVVLILTVSLTLPGVTSNVGSNPWQAIEISPAALYQIDYGSRRIEIRESLRNREQPDIEHKTYYVSPLCELDSFSAVPKWNHITKEFEVRFAVQMWDEELIQTAWEYLKQNVYFSLPQSRVQLVPIQSVALRCSECKGFGINGSPLRVTALPKRVHFALTCETREEADRLAALMKSDPEHFQILRLAFALQGQPLETKVLAVQFYSTLNGDLYTQIKQQLPGKTKAFLLPADEERLKRQFVQGLQARYMWKSPDIQENYAQELEVGVHHFLVDSRLDSSRFSRSSWQYLFWLNNDGLMRPDILAERLSEICKNYDTSLVQNWFQDTATTTNYTKETRQEAEKEIKKSFKVKNVTEFLVKAREFVRWNGARLVPKTPLLTEIYLYDRIDSRNNRSFPVTVQFNSAALLRDITVRVEDTQQEQTEVKKEIVAIRKYLETNITKEIKELRVQFVEKAFEQTFVTVENGNITGNHSQPIRNIPISTSVERNTQALAYLTGLFAHFHRRNRTLKDPLWYSSIRTSFSDVINNLNDYGLVTYSPPEESVWLAIFREKDILISLRNFWTKSEQNVQRIHTGQANTSVVWDPITSKFLSFNERVLKVTSKQSSTNSYGYSEREREVTTDAPWLHVLDISFDWITRNLYILSSNNSCFYVLSTEKPYSWTLINCTHTNDLTERVVVDPVGGYIFWSTKSSLIRRSWLNGNNVTTIWNPKGSFTISPWSLTLDHENGTLYFVDSSEKNITAMDRDGNILKSIQLKWANGEEANLFEKSKNLNKIPGGFIVMGPNQVYFLDLNSEIINPVDDVTVESASRYAVFSPSLSSFPKAVNPCSRIIVTDCPQRSRYYNNSQKKECWNFTETPCGNKVCLHNPHGEYYCY